MRNDSKEPGYSKATLWSLAKLVFCDTRFKDFFLLLVEYFDIQLPLTNVEYFQSVISNAPSLTLEFNLVLASDKRSSTSETFSQERPLSNLIMIFAPWKRKASEENQLHSGKQKVVKKKENDVTYLQYRGRILG